MNWCRTIPGFVRVLVALFLVAQFAGVVSSPRANAQAIPAASQLGHHQHAHDHGSTEHQHRGLAGDLADTCCALHAYFAGILPPAVELDRASIVGELLAIGPDDLGLGLAPDRLDRPPRPRS